MKSQAMLDFMISYGIAFLMLGMTLYIIAHLSFVNQTLAPSYCTASPSFSCPAFALTHNGILTIALSQATGGTVNVNAAACSSTVNTMSDAPAYGNVKIVSYALAPQFYPSNSNLQTPLSMYSSAIQIMSVYCYSGSGIATSGPGSPFSGYLWINYTITNLPSTTNTVQRVVEFSTKYT
jgi:hypothetical protein